MQENRCRALDSIEKTPAEFARRLLDGRQRQSWRVTGNKKLCSMNSFARMRVEGRKERGKNRGDWAKWDWGKVGKAGKSEPGRNQSAQGEENGGKEAPRRARETEV